MEQYLRADIIFTKFLLERIEWAIKPYELFNKSKKYEDTIEKLVERWESMLDQE